ncbi:unnamed protein product [Amoebophrya sp. A120]|nr:unnamed protein product [Amoebophrya sp. A120]|eukprot:GSA120T00023080001.1
MFTLVSTKPALFPALVKNILKEKLDFTILLKEKLDFTAPVSSERINIKLTFFTRLTNYTPRRKTLILQHTLLKEKFDFRHITRWFDSGISKGNSVSKCILAPGNINSSRIFLVTPKKARVLML